MTNLFIHRKILLIFWGLFSGKFACHQIPVIFGGKFVAEIFGTEDTLPTSAYFDWLPRYE